jgi:hypothetical protein
MGQKKGCKDSLQRHTKADAFDQIERKRSVVSHCKVKKEWGKEEYMCAIALWVRLGIEGN